MLKPTVRRSACDQCRAKRVRCLRAENCTARCARCSHIGARCVTGAPGRPGRPPKSRLVDGGSTLRGPAVSPADVSSPGPGRHRTSTLRDMDHVEVHASATAGQPAPAGAPARALQCRADRHTSWDWLDGIAGSDLAGSRSAVHPPPAGHPLAYGAQPDQWGAPGDRSAFFGPSSIEQSLAPSEDILGLVNQLSSPSQLQGLLSADDALKSMLHMGRDSSTALDMDIDPLLDPWEGVLPPSPLPQCFRPASSLIRFREEIDQRIAALDAYFSDPLKVAQSCKEEGADRVAENPVALLLTCCKEFIDIIQSLTPAGLMHIQGEYALSTEIVLLALSSYLALMRLLDSLFYAIYKFICQMPPDSFKSVKIKSVLRIGGISSLQDMPLKIYAIGILDAIQSQVRTIERFMGIPTECCLSSEAATSPAAAAPGIFARADRARLFWAALAQEDIKSRRGSKSYVDSIRASIQDSMRFLDD
ncbi:hypothetical protein JDV02_004037 [Purpureocillium takamizusanense]|uniref:Zn(2)-C6 fungal-type domain-containing protein n=1 Tax=Purpureocillium takamizusanense TaxID=2060973 RepID=A0A9Q8QDM9_9HYPO|nr:uncharacterized protein JDV02_004037 [Purpureocillium takamizusanense]UNI17715.1 hypothetical protein JDV02_004037 [Purpureocillium takamizusanense]